jgi:hypothetical protein
VASTSGGNSLRNLFASDTQTSMLAGESAITIAFKPFGLVIANCIPSIPPQD